MRKENKEEHFFTDEELGITAKLSKLNLTKEDQDFLRNGLQEILSHFDTMAGATINKELHKETSFQSNDLRSDNSIDSAKRWKAASCKSLLNSSPDSEDDHIVVPNVL